MAQALHRQPDMDYLSIPSSRRTYEIVSIIAYLIGVKQSNFEKESLNLGIYNRLDIQQSAKIIRCLCQIRSTLLKRYKEIDYAIQYDLKNLDNMGTLFELEDFEFLHGAGIHFLKSNYRVDAYIADVNRYIVENIHVCRELFPLWLEWDYVKNLFIMPGGAKETGIKKERMKYLSAINNYPFHAYINWPLGDNGNILHHDAKFVSLLYAANRVQFTEWNKVMDVGHTTEDGLYGFIAANEKIALMVDCENSDPYKLCAVLRNLSEKCSESIHHIRKIILYDDIHSASAWQVLGRFIDIPIEHEVVQRINENKSLVDIRMTAGTCKEYFQNQIDAFILLSSDSDYWGLISALPDAKFLVMLEYGKCSHNLRERLSDSNIFYCFIDDFYQGSLSDIKLGALLAEVRPYVERSIHLNVNTMLDTIYTRTRIEMSPAEKKNFYEKYIKGMRLFIDDEGNVGIVV